MAQTIVGAMDLYWGSLHCVCTLMVPPHPNGHTFRNTTWSKASFASPYNINNFVAVKNSKG